MAKIRAVLFVSDQALLIDASFPSTRKPFGQAHELGHHAIRWHREILYVCSEWDLSYSTRKEMEFEANQFAGEFLIPTPLLNQIYAEYPVSVETVLHMSQLSAASIHACFVRFVADCPKACCLLTLDKENGPEGNLQLQMKKKPLYSPAWHRERTAFVKHDQILGANHIVTRFVDNPDAPTVQHVTIRIGDQEFPTDLFTNNYNVFVLFNAERS